MAHVPAEFQQVASICTATETEIGGETVIGIADHRDLHAGLGVKTPAKDWIKRRISDLGLVQGIDFEIEEQKCSALTADGHARAVVAKVYRLTLDAAKTIAMAEKTAQGALVRRYFLWCEKQAFERAPALPDDLTSDPIILLRMEQIKLERRTAALETAQRRQALIQRDDEFRMRRLELEAGIDSTRETARLFLQKSGLKADAATVKAFGFECRLQTILLGISPKDVPQVPDGRYLARLWPKEALLAAYEKKFGGAPAIQATAPTSAQHQ